MKFKSLVIAIACFATIAAAAKDLRTAVFVTEPQMHCGNCEKRIKENLRFEKGIKDIVTNLDDKTVPIKYDADKTTTGKIVDAFAQIDYADEEVGNTAGNAGEVAVFKAEQMSCGGCAAKVKRTLTAVEGVDSVSVDLPTKAVRVEFNPSKVNVDGIKAAFATIGYNVSLFSE